MSYIHEVIVRAAVNGTRQALTFPLDMLRYDMLAPSNSESLDVIQSSISGEEEACYCPKEPERWPTVKLCREGGKTWKPTTARWQSFGWSVVNHEVRRV
jgi:hypothetical protein